MHYFKDKIQQFSAQLLNWYSLNQRNLPWRHTSDPYKIWLSEIILQQTKISQGLSYYLKFIEHYPTIHRLAQANEEEILKDWQGLGYYSRARNLHFTAKYISLELSGKFPNTYSEIKKLKGIGDYTAAAIASFAFNLPNAVVDGNVYRVLSRIFGINTPIDSTTGKKEFSSLANMLLSKEKPADHNQAIMDFGATICTPKKPNCTDCPFANNCVALLSNSIETLPFKAKKIKQQVKFLNYLLIISNNNEIAINYRNKKGIWQNLYDFPLIESEKAIPSNKLQSLDSFKSILQETEYLVNYESEVRKHILSHRILYAKFHHIKINSFAEIKNVDFEIIKLSKLREKPVPKLIENYLNEVSNLLSLFNTKQKL